MAFRIEIIDTGTFASLNLYKITPPTQLSLEAHQSLFFFCFFLFVFFVQVAGLFCHFHLSFSLK